MTENTETNATKHKQLSQKFGIFCHNNNIKLILASPGGHRGTCLVKPMIQTLKIRLSLQNIDRMWAKKILAEKITLFIENIKLIPNKNTRFTVVEAHFGRAPNTHLTNILTSPNSNTLNYKKNKEILFRQEETEENQVERGRNMEPRLRLRAPIDFHYRTPTISDTESDEQPLISERNTPAQKRKTISPTRITTDKLSITLGVKTSVIVKSKTLDTPTMKDTVILKSDIAVGTETKSRLIEFVECKTVGEYSRKRQNLNKFCLDEQKSKGQTSATAAIDYPRRTIPNGKKTTTVHIKPDREAKTKDPEKKCHSKSKTENGTPTKRNEALRTTSPFDIKSKQAALAQSKTRRNSLFINTDIES